VLGRRGFPVPPNNRLLDHNHKQVTLPNVPSLNQCPQCNGSFPYGLHLQSPTTRTSISKKKIQCEQSLQLYTHTSVKACNAVQCSGVWNKAIQGLTVEYTKVHIQATQECNSPSTIYSLARTYSSSIIIYLQVGIWNSMYAFEKYHHIHWFTHC
jgi:hypothetical protein